MTELALTNMILREASRFIGLREVKPNARWDDPTTPDPDTELCKELREMMRPSPWQEGWAYCAAFCEGVVVESLRRLGGNEAEIGRFAEVMNAHVMSSYNGFKKLGLISPTPSPGALWLAQHGSTPRGHAGIVTVASSKRTMATIEANTSLDASTPAKEREGDWITTRFRNVAVNGSLVTRGFLPVANVLKLVQGR